MRSQAGSITLPVTAALAPYLRVKMNAAGTSLEAAGANDVELGTLEQRAVTGDTVASVVPRNAEGSRLMVAAGAFSKYARLFGAAGGKVDDAPTDNFVGIALEAAAADNDQVEVLPLTLHAPIVTQTAKTDTATITAAELLTKVLDGTPTAAATYTLPTAALLVAAIPGAKVGDSFRFVVNNKSGGANTITVAAGAGGTGDGTLTVAQNIVRDFLVIVTNATAAAEAYFVYGIG